MAFQVLELAGRVFSFAGIELAGDLLEPSLQRVPFILELLDASAVRPAGGRSRRACRTGDPLNSLSLLSKATFSSRSDSWLDWSMAIWVLACANCRLASEAGAGVLGAPDCASVSFCFRSWFSAE